MNEKQSRSNRIVYLEQLRVIALFFVLYCHSGFRCLGVYLNTDYKLLQLISIFVAGICQFCIPVFFMISGAVLLRKEERFSTILKKRFLPMLGTTFCIVMFQYIYDVIFHQQLFSLQGLLESFYKGGYITEQWFLYAYLSFLLILPFLQSLVMGIKDCAAYWYLLALLVIFQIITPSFEIISDWQKVGIELPILNSIVIYPLLGYFLENRAPKILFSTKWKRVIGIAALVVALGNCGMNYHSYMLGKILAYDTLFISIYAIALFILFKPQEISIDAEKQTEKQTEKTAQEISGVVDDKKESISRSWGNKMWIAAGSGVFGTYLFERQFRDVFGLFTISCENNSIDYLLGLIELLLILIVGCFVVNLVKMLVRDKCISTQKATKRRV